MRPVKTPAEHSVPGAAPEETPVEGSEVPAPAYRGPQYSAPANGKNGAPMRSGSTGPLSAGHEDEASIPGIAGLPPLQVLEAAPDGQTHARARRRLSLWVGLTALVLVLLGELLMLSPWADPAANATPRQVSAIPLTEVRPYGVNTFLHKEVDLWKKEKTLDLARDMGATWIKQQFPWAEIEFTKDGYWDAKNNQNAWDKFDNIVDLAQQRGLQIIARIDSTPEWARTDDNMDDSVKRDLINRTNAPPSPGHLLDFQLFIEKFVSRYKGRIAAIQVWNEPNLKSEWYPSVNAKNYAALLQYAYIGAKSADPNIIVVAAPLATTNETIAYQGNLNELDYLQAMYYAGAQQYFDVMDANAYGTSYAPEDPPSPQKLNFRRVELLHKVMEDNGDRNKPVWFNEYGWNASPDNCCATYNWGRVTPEQQADYTVRGMQYAAEHWPWAGVFTIWYLRQVGDIQPNMSEYYFGLVNSEFVPGPAYKAVKKVATEQHVATPGEWGVLSNPVHVGPRWQAMYDPTVPGSIYLLPSANTAENSDGLDLLFRGTDVTVRVVPPALASGQALTDTITARYYVTVDGNSQDAAGNLQRDDMGHAYFELPANGQATEVTVVHNLGSEFRTGEHKLRITVSKVAEKAVGEQGAGHVAAPMPEEQRVNLPGIASFTVEAQRSYVLFTITTLLLLAGIAAEAYALWRSRAQAAVPALRRTVAGSHSPGSR